MTVEEYIKEKTTVHMGSKNYLSEEDACDAVDKARKELAWHIHELICEGRSFSFIDEYVTNICDF